MTESEVKEGLEGAEKTIDAEAVDMFRPCQTCGVARGLSMAHALLHLHAELNDYKLLHRQSVMLVFPGERDSPGAYRKMLRDAEAERDALKARCEQLNEALSEALERIRVLKGGSSTPSKEIEAMRDNSALRLERDTLKARCEQLKQGLAHIRDKTIIGRRDETDKANLIAALHYVASTTISATPPKKR
jgi:FtsZ-binding cell division protein ZapB